MHMRRPWIAFRVDVEPPFESALTKSLATWLVHERRCGRLGRWFFLWYSESGFHLRLRLQPARGQESEHLASALERFCWSRSGGFRLERQIYDRRVLAFGEVRETVLGELLHVYTTELALELIAGSVGEVGSARRWIVTAGAAATLMRRAIPDPELRAAARDWVAFAGRSARQLGFNSRADGRRDQLLPALGAAMPRVEAALRRCEAVHRIVALLRRTRRRGGLGRFVAMHAVHLFCNEMGLGLDQEYELASGLFAIWTPGFGESGQRRHCEAPSPAARSAP